VLALALAAACTNPGRTSPPRPSPSASTSSGLSSIAAALQKLAQASAASSYSAAYLFRRSRPASSVVVRVWHDTSSLRVDVVAAAQTATLIITPNASYSCALSRHRRLCFRVAARGKPVPAPFNISPATLFSTDLRQLGTDTEHYLVGPATPTAPHATVPGATCFDVTPGPGALSPRVPAGTYCFAPSVLTSVRYPSGNTVQLSSLRLAAPTASAFRPYAKPTPLPG
jgi:hypothetical protein